jgi:hypothetical protein
VAPKDEKAKDRNKYDGYNFNKAAEDYGFAAAVITADTSGALKGFFKMISDEMKRTGKPPTQYQFDKWAVQNEWFKKYDSVQKEAFKSKNNPVTAGDYKRDVEVKGQQIRQMADTMGIPITDEEIFGDNGLAEQARFNGWTNVEIQNNLMPNLQAAFSTGADLKGTSGDVQTDLMEWSRRNGLDLTPTALSRYVQDAVTGKQTVDDIKADLRKTYLVGAFPAWADRIEQGYDPEVIAAPGQARIAKLLEMEESQITFDDPLLQRYMQGVGNDGKPSVVPLYELDKSIREDPRWDQTDNAYETYTKVGTDLLRIFGVR